FWPTWTSRWGSAGTPRSTRSAPRVSSSTRAERGLLALGLVLEHLAEGALQLRGHALLEQREQRLGGEGAQRVHSLDQLVPALVGLTGALKGLPELFEEQPRERARDRFAIAADALDERERRVQRDPERD